MSHQPSVNVPGIASPTHANLRVLPQVVERYEIMMHAEVKYRHIITKVYRVAFLMFTVILLSASALLVLDGEKIAAVIAIGIALTTFRWFVMSFLDDRFE